MRLWQGQQRRPPSLQQPHILQHQMRHPILGHQHLDPAQRQRAFRQRPLQRAIQPRLDLGHRPDRQRDPLALGGIDQRGHAQDQHQQKQLPAQPAAMPPLAPLAFGPVRFRCGDGRDRPGALRRHRVQSHLGPRFRPQDQQAPFRRKRPIRHLSPGTAPVAAGSWTAVSLREGSWVAAAPASGASCPPVSADPIFCLSPLRPAILRCLYLSRKATRSLPKSCEKARSRP